MGDYCHQKDRFSLCFQEKEVCHAVQCHLGKNLRQLGGEAVKRQCEPRPLFFSIYFIYLFVVALGLLQLQ